MKKTAAIAGAVFVFMAAVILWIDANPRIAAAPFELKSGITIDLPLGWPKPDEEYGIVSISAGPGDGYPWMLSLQDAGAKAKMDGVIEELRKGDGDLAGAIREVKLRNGIVAKSWIFTQSMVELSQDNRVYVFVAPNGHVYWAMLPLPKSWRKARRYDAIFRGVVGSMRFKS
ncbi:MAG: hypothetical protein HYV14_03270 [Elusimicrobia bacterium]|nr:hypothetical protein [Elusimicrobiota bacterium]